MDRYYVNDGGEIEDSHRPDGCQTLDEVEIVKLLNQLADRDAEIERLRADLVWAVEKGACAGPVYLATPLLVNNRREVCVKHNGTPESICRAVREARDGV